MCYNSEHNRRKEQEQMMADMIQNTRSKFYNTPVITNVKGEDVIMSAWEVWQDAIRTSVKDRHPITHEPLDGE